MKIDTILFDLDGTLWETSKSTYDSANEIAKKYHLKEISMETVNRCMGLGFEDCARNYIPDLDIEEAKKIMLEMFSHSVDVIARNGPNLYPKVIETIKRLKKDYKIGLVSNCAKFYMDTFVRLSGLEPWIDYQVPAVHLGVSKGQAIANLVKENNLNAIYVGDTALDLKSCQEAGIPFIHAEYGFGKGLNEKYHISEIKELPKLIKTIK